MPVTLRPWKMELALKSRAMLDSCQQALSDALARWGGLFIPDAEEIADALTIAGMLARGEAYLQPTPFGDVLILGPAGRARHGQNFRQRPSVNTVLDRAYIHRSVKLLEAELDYRYQGPQGRTLHRLKGPDGHEHLMCAQARGHSVRSLRRILRRHQGELVRAGAKLIVITPDLRRAGMIASNQHYLVEVIRHALASQPNFKHPSNRRNARPKPGQGRRVRPQVNVSSPLLQDAQEQPGG